MTQEDFIRKYGDIVVCLESKEKEACSFQASLENGNLLTCGILSRGCSFTVGENVLVKELSPVCGKVFDPQNKVLEEFEELDDFF
jgi:hypothetical protein